MRKLPVQSHVIRQMIGHALKARPVEACGYLAGKGDLVTAIFPLRNADNSEEHYAFDPQEQFETVREIRKRGLETLAVYHSHPASPARPSPEDIRLAYDPDISYVIVSLEGSSTSVKSFRIAGAVVEEEEISIVG